MAGAGGATGASGLVLGAIVAWCCVGGVSEYGQKFTSCETEPCEPGSTGSDGTGGQVGVGGESGGSGKSSSSSAGKTGAQTGQTGSGGGDAGAAGAADASGCAESCTLSCCDGACVDLNRDEAHCGECGRNCELPNAEAACRDGECEVRQCRSGYFDCNGKAKDGCEQVASEPLAPVPLWPVMGAFSGSLHARDTAAALTPTFTWTAADPTGCGNVSYHLQIDDECPLTGFQACAMPTPEVDETGILETTFELREDLPVEELTAPLGRRYFWRVRACDEAMAVCSDWSEVRYLDVGRLKEDVNGDGYADLVAASGQSLWFVPGAADFRADLTVSAKPVAPEVIRLHSGDVKLRFVGDVDGDGFNDLTASADLLGEKQLVTQALLVHGGPAFEEGNAMTIGIGRPGDGNVSLYSAGDFNHDGFADLVLSMSGGLETPAWLAFHPGGAPLEKIVSEDSVWEAPEGTEAYWYGYEVVTGDYNGDGYPDMALSLGKDGKAHVLLGGAEPDFDSDIEYAFIADDAACAPGIIATLNMNGDAFDDLAALCPAARQLWVQMGSSGLAGGAEWTAMLTRSPRNLTAGDLDANGFDDIFFPGPTVFSGAPDPQTEPSYNVAPPPPHDADPVAVADHDGDGYLDLAQAGYWYPGPHSPAIPSPVIVMSGEDELAISALAR